MVPISFTIPTCAANFTAITGGRVIDSYLWNFGDGTTANTPTANHMFDWGRGYTVTLSTTSDGVTTNVSRYYGGCAGSGSASAMIPI
jgi:PKD repeat protein